MSNFSEELAGVLLAHMLDLFRFDSGERRRILKLLTAMQEEVILELNRIDADSLGSLARVKRLNSVLKEIEGIIKNYYGEMAVSSTASLQEIARLELGFASSSVNQLAGVALFSEYKLTDVFLKTLVSDVLIEGAPSKEWWARQATGTLERFKDQLRRGVALGESNSKLIERVMGRRTGRTQKVTLSSGKVVEAPIYQGGVIETSKRNAASLVRSSVQAIANASRMEVYQANSDLILGYQALAVLDGRTSDICIARSGAVWDINGKPLAGVDYVMPGPPPWHWNCRTLLIPVLKSWQDISVDKIITAPPGATQTSMDGQVSADFNYETWLKTKGDVFARKVLGKTRYQWWKAGKLELKDLVDQYNRILTLEQLERKIAA